MKYTLLIFSFFLSVLVSAQGYNPKGGKYNGKKTKYRSPSGTLKRNQTDVFPLDADFKLNGFYAGIGGTYMYPWKESDEKFYSKQTFNDTTLEIFTSFQGKPSGKLGLYAEVGWFHSFQNPTFFHFLDLGLSYRQYKGSEDFSGNKKLVFSDSLGNVLGTAPSSLSQSDTYSDQIVSFSANLTNHFHFSRYGFVQNGIGVNVDYFFSKSRSGGPVFPGYEAKFLPDIQAQLHYRFGVGWKASPTILVIPSIELPLLTLYEFDEFRSALPYFSTRHYPIIFSVRIMFLRRISEDCVVPQYDGPSNFE
jgi:hypothetical protein